GGSGNRRNDRGGFDATASVVALTIIRPRDTGRRVAETASPRRRELMNSRVSTRGRLAAGNRLRRDRDATHLATTGERRVVEVTVRGERQVRYATRVAGKDVTGKALAPLLQ